MRTSITPGRGGVRVQPCSPRGGWFEYSACPGVTRGAPQPRRNAQVCSRSKVRQKMCACFTLLRLRWAVQSSGQAAAIARKPIRPTLRHGSDRRCDRADRRVPRKAETDAPDARLTPITMPTHGIAAGGHCLASPGAKTACISPVIPASPPQRPARGWASDRVERLAEAGRQAVQDAVSAGLAMTLAVRGDGWAWSLSWKCNAGAGFALELKNQGRMDPFVPFQ